MQPGRKCPIPVTIQYSQPVGSSKFFLTLKVNQLFAVKRITIFVR